MRGGVTLQQHLSLAGHKPRTSPAINSISLENLKVMGKNQCFKKIKIQGCLADHLRQVAGSPVLAIDPIWDAHICIFSETIFSSGALCLVEIYETRTTFQKHWNPTKGETFFYLKKNPDTARNWNYGNSNFIHSYCQPFYMPTFFLAT